MDLASHDIAGEKRRELLNLFPEIRAEGGKIDFERLRLALGEAVDVGRERYGMNWPGKADCFKTLQQPSLGTLLPCPEESVNFDTSENLIIEGDNLEVLKLLQKSYLGKVKMIYIDPPYNTGNDFIYPDNYTESLQTYLEYTGQVDGNGRKFSTNTDTDGRFHSKWLNMMYPRLYLARNLLREDGVIWISCDDTEQSNLRQMANEIFGEENFVANVIWEKKYAPQNDAKWLSDNHDYVLLYARNKDVWRPTLLPRSQEANARYQNPDNDPRGPWKSSDLSVKTYSAAYDYPIKTPSGRVVTPPEGRCWVVPKGRFAELVADNRIWFGTDGNSVPSVKRFLSEVKEGITSLTIWKRDEVGDNQNARRIIREFFGDIGIFDTPKSIGLIKKMLILSTQRLPLDIAFEPEIILDFFAGSGTTAHAMLDLNKQDDGNRKFILVQLPEPTGREDYQIIADITKERVRRVIKKLNDEDAAREPGLFDENAPEQDRGFRVFKLAESNFKPWDAGVPHDEKALVRQLELHIDHICPGRQAEDILYEILLKSGFPLTAPVEMLTLAGKTVYSAVGGAFLICLERELTIELIRAMTGRKPERVVCLDEGFAGNDQLKANAVQFFKTKGVTSFKTV
jgi:adenine-specific DNA-methyltransferase